MNDAQIFLQFFGNYIDSAGFLDTKGAEQEIISSYATAKLFKRGSKTKIIMVIEIASLISTRGKIIADVANRLAELFPDDFEKFSAFNSFGDFKS